jgi:polyphenol oxidase
MLEPLTLPGGIAALVSADFRSAGFLAAFTERSGGVSDGPFATLNLGLRAGDDAARAAENRKRAATALGLASFAVVRQVHGATRFRVDRERAGAGFADPGDAMGAGDALFTDEPNLGIAILTADCVPVALADPETGRLAAIHAGWRGVAAGVIADTLREFDDPRRILAAVGPAIGPDHYEVGEEVVSAVGAVTTGGPVVQRGGPKPRLDLPGTIARILSEAGVRRIESASLCTACQPDRFFSHRRDGVTGRQALIAARSG